MRIQAREDGRTRGAAATAIIEMRKPQSLLSQSIDIGRFNLAAKTADIGIAHVVGKQHDNIRSVLCTGSHNTTDQQDQGDKRQTNEFLNRGFQFHGRSNLVRVSGVGNGTQANGSQNRPIAV